MISHFRAYFPVGGKIARCTAWRLFSQYKIRPRLIARTVSPADRLFPLWTVDALPAQLPDELYLQALLDIAKRESDDRPAILYLCADPSSLPRLDLLEHTFILCRPDGTTVSSLGENGENKEGDSL